MTERPDPYRSVARELLCVLADEGRPMSLRELQQPGRLAGDDAAFQLSVARVAGFVRAVPGTGVDPAVAPPREPSYQPTTLGWMIARSPRSPPWKMPIVKNTHVPLLICAKF